MENRSSKGLPHSIRRIHAPNIATLPALLLPVGLQNRIPPSPAEPDCPNLVRAGYHTHGVDEAVDQRPRDTFAVLGEPRTQRGGHDGGILGLVDHAERLLLLERGLNVVEEGDGQGVALVEVGHVGVKARFGVLVGEEADVGECVPEN